VEDVDGVGRSVVETRSQSGALPHRSEWPVARAMDRQIGERVRTSRNAIKECAQQVLIQPMHWEQTVLTQPRRHQQRR
jgi:hypothetical protein